MLVSSKKIKTMFLAVMLASLSTVNALAKDTSSCTSKKFNIKLNSSVSLSEILNQLSDECDFTILTKDEHAQKQLDKNVSGVNIKNLSLSNIFRLLIGDRNLNYDFSGNVLKISKLETKFFKLDYITSIREGGATVRASAEAINSGSNGNGGNGGSGDGNFITSTEKFDFWSKLGNEIKSIVNNSSETIVAPDPIINPNTGIIAVTGTKSQLNRVEKYIKELSRSLKKQVLIDVSIITVNLNNGHSKGVNWSKFNLDFNPILPTITNNGNDQGSGSNGGGANNTNNSPKSFIEINGIENPIFNINSKLNFNISGLINFLNTNGKTKIISSPKITTLNNQQALISIGDTIYYKLKKTNTVQNGGNSGQTTESGDDERSSFVGILLNILPEISDDNKIILRINPTISALRSDSIDSKGERERAPDTTQKKLSTVVRVQDGDTIILGGLIGQTKAKSSNNVPVLSRIPLLGNLFKYRQDNISTEETIFVITPHIIDLDKNKNKDLSLKDLGFSKDIYE